MRRCLRLETVRGQTLGSDACNPSPGSLTGRRVVPRFVKDEFDAFLECGVLARGFLRLRCGECGHDKLVAFSCKRRGFCPSCGARRMSQTAAHLVDHVIPHVPVRQWVLSLPIPLRVLLAAQPELVTPVLQVVQRVLTRHLLDDAGLRADEGQGGAVTLIQRFGSAANLNIHLHCLVLDGVYRCAADGSPAFIEVAAPTDDALHALLQTLITRLMKMLTRRGVLVEDMGQTYLAEPDADGEEARTLRPLQAAAITYRIAFGPRAGRHKHLPTGPQAALPAARMALRRMPARCRWIQGQPRYEGSNDPQANLQGPAESRQDDVAAVRSKPSGPASASHQCVTRAFRAFRRPFEFPIHPRHIVSAGALSDESGPSQRSQNGTERTPRLEQSERRSKPLLSGSVNFRSRHAGALGKPRDERDVPTRSEPGAQYKSAADPGTEMYRR